MLKKIILILLICGLAVSGFAQKSKRKSPQKSPKSEYFTLLIDGEETPKERYCPGDPITFTFESVPTIDILNYCWKSTFSPDSICNTKPITLSFPTPNTFTVSLIIDFQADSIMTEVLSVPIVVDYIRTVLDTSVCQGKEISVSIDLLDSIVFYDYENVQSDILTPWDTIRSSVSGCDSLVRWHITMNPYILEEYKISSCDSVIWCDSILGDIIVKRPPDVEGDWETSIERIFEAKPPGVSCDTLKILKITIIDTPYVNIIFDQEAFCKGDDMSGSIELETNFTAFDWKFVDMDKDSTFTEYEKNIDIEYSGHYYVHAYMDTSLYDTLPGLRIVNCFRERDTLVEDCDLIIPNLITPDGDDTNEILGIKKLNPRRFNELTISDRWGKTVFHQKNYKCVFKNNDYENKEDAFSGLSQGGQKLPDGTYYYSFKYEKIPKPKKYTGTITILRKK